MKKTYTAAEVTDLLLLAAEAIDLYASYRAIEGMADGDAKQWALADLREGLEVDMEQLEREWLATAGTGAPDPSPKEGGLPW
jgi:hypothetical protein